MALYKPVYSSFYALSEATQLLLSLRYQPDSAYSPEQSSRRNGLTILITEWDSYFVMNMLRV